MPQVVGISHECDFPEETKRLPRLTRSRALDARLTSKEVDEWVRGSLHEDGSIYAIDELHLAELRPDMILTQKLCDVCAIGYETVRQLAMKLPGRPMVVNLDPSSLSDIFENIRQVGAAADVLERAETVVTDLSKRVEIIHQRAANIPSRPRCCVMEWVDPLFCSGHWGPELIELAGGYDPLGRKHQRSIEIKWEAVVEARPEIIVLALCGYDLDRAKRDYELLKTFPGFDRDARKSLATAGPWLAAAIALIVALPHLVWLVQNDFLPFAYVSARAQPPEGLFDHILHPSEFPEFICDVESEKAWRVVDT